jgi:hypothetical protein
MNSEEIKRVLQHVCGDRFVGVFPKDRLPTKIDTLPAFLVVNTDKAGKPGEHWLGVAIDKDRRGEMFDSLAVQPPDAIISNFMNNITTRWTYSTKQIQSYASRFCGHYTVFYIAFRSLNYDLNYITNVFTNDTGVNDALVHSFVCHRMMTMMHRR